MDDDLVGLDGRAAEYGTMLYGKDMDLITALAALVPLKLVVGVEPFSN
jgi:hypothetical protein